MSDLSHWRKQGGGDEKMVKEIKNVEMERGSLGRGRDGEVEEKTRQLN